MHITRLELENYTVFAKNSFEFEQGVNILIGENGTGKTHILKILYSACQAADTKVSFSNKLVRTMLPDDYKISRLLTRKPGNHTATVKVCARTEKSEADRTLSMTFSNKTKKWDAEERGTENWERMFRGMSSIFIPAKEILSNSYNLPAAVDKGNVKFDDTYIDVVNSAKIDISAGRNPDEKKHRLNRIEEIIGGSVTYDGKNDEFYLKRGHSKQEFTLVAEGIRKMALLWQLVKNGTLEKGSVLFWDEPEANINPIYIEIIVELLLELSRDGVQIFLATHDYMLAKYFEVRRTSEDKIRFHSFQCDKQGVVEYTQGFTFGDLKNNVIIESFNKLLDEIYALEEV